MAVLPTPPPDKAMSADMSDSDSLNDASSINSSLPDDIFGHRYRRKDHVDSFAERHVKLAKQTSEEQMWAGRKPLEGVQGKHFTSFPTAVWRMNPQVPALLIITWWYWCNARYVHRLLSNLFCPNDLVLRWVEVIMPPCILAACD